jgi:uncharacterized damage-inducible protein DinB
MHSTISSLFVEDVKKRLIDESIGRIHKCLAMLTEVQVKYSFNEQTNSIANLIVHLEGNCKQWMFNSFLEDGHERNRSDEFSNNINLTIENLKQKLDLLQERIIFCLDTIKEEQLTSGYTIQGFEVNGVSILVHVTEHFSYHTGQIALITKILVNQATLFYDDSALNAFKK